jgi:hypothetical protein
MAKYRQGRAVYGLHFDILECVDIKYPMQSRTTQSDCRQDLLSELLPPGPTSISFLKCTPWFLRWAMRAGKSCTRRTMRFHPHGSRWRPSGIGREPEALGPRRISLRLPIETWAKVGRFCWSGLKPTDPVGFGRKTFKMTLNSGGS